MNEVVALIKYVFKKTDRQWKIRGKYVEPVDEHIKFMLNISRKIKDGESFESGGIMVVSDAGHLDVYVHVGELEQEKS